MKLKTLLYFCVMASFGAGYILGSHRNSDRAGQTDDPASPGQGSTIDYRTRQIIERPLQIREYDLAPFFDAVRPPRKEIEL